MQLLLCAEVASCQDPRPPPSESRQPSEAGEKHRREGATRREDLSSIPTPSHIKSQAWWQALVKPSVCSLTSVAEWMRARPRRDPVSTESKQKVLPEQYPRQTFGLHKHNLTTHTKCTNVQPILFYCRCDKLHEVCGSTPQKCVF